MLAITESAAAAITALVSQSEMPQGSGARIAADGAGQGLELALVPGPAEHDMIVEGQGATIYLEPRAAGALDDKVLDVERYTEPNGEEQLRFALAPQGGSEFDF
jgi:iron-sulfur cluster assembly protein